MDIIYGFVLAGGRSARMGRTKALLKFPKDEPMVTVVARHLETVCDRVFTVVKERPTRGWPSALEFVEESPDLPMHPLSGVVTALTTLNVNEWALIVPCDVPFLESAGLRTVVEMGLANGGAVAHDGERLHPLVALLPQIALDRAMACLREASSMHHFASNLKIVDLASRLLQNINAPTDLKRS